MSFDDLLYYLAFSHFLGIGPMKFSALKKHFGSAKKAYLAGRKELTEVIGVVLTEKFLDFRNKFDPVKKLAELKKKEITVLTVDSDNYPQSVRNISDPPICIYLKGDLNVIASPDSIGTKQSPNEARHRIFESTSPPKGESPKSLTQKQVPTPLLYFSIVGTRSPTQYGIQVARKFAYELATAGFVIVSGMAYGIDTVAHKSCLEASGKTIAVLGCGVDIVYPASNRNLYEKIIETGGAIISEFPPGQLVLKGLFVARNRIISALSAGVMIVEGAEDSGSLITARYAAVQGREVFAPPGPIDSPMSSAPNLLLKQGAKLVTSIEDIFEEFNIKISPKKNEEIRAELSQEEEEIFEILKKESLTVNEMVLITKKPITDILNLISSLEIKKVVEKNPQGRYEVVV